MSFGGYHLPWQGRDFGPDLRQAGLVWTWAHHCWSTSLYLRCLHLASVAVQPRSVCWLLPLPPVSERKKTKMLKGCRTLPAAARSTRVARSNNARFLSSAALKAAAPVAARKAAFAAAAQPALAGAGRIAAMRAGSAAACKRNI